MPGTTSLVPKSAIIVAGGTGKRMGGQMPKQFLPLAGKPLLFHAIEAFHGYDGDMQLVVVLPPDHMDHWKALCKEQGLPVEHQVVAGGEERFHSVQNGLQAVRHGGLVAVHDGARPLADRALIARCFQGAGEYGTAVPVVPVSSSVRQVQGKSSRAMARNTLRMVQTPQCFRVDLLRKAFEQAYDPAFTDEATLVERLGVEVHLVEGEARNIKVTGPVDLAVAEALCGTQNTNFAP